MLTLKRIWTYLPNLLLFSFLIVFAFPNASIRGFVASICFSMLPTPALPATVDKYCKINFVDTVLPAPLSHIIMLCSAAFFGCFHKLGQQWYKCGGKFSLAIFPPDIYSSRLRHIDLDFYIRFIHYHNTCRGIYQVVFEPFPYVIQNRRLVKMY